MKMNGMVMLCFLISCFTPVLTENVNVETVTFNIIENFGITSNTSMLGTTSVSKLGRCAAECSTIENCIAAVFDSARQKCKMYQEFWRFDEDNSGTITAITLDCPYYNLEESVPSK